MLHKKKIRGAALVAGASAVALAAVSTGAFAGAFQVNEQSTVFLGSASAGAGAGGSIGSMYYNPAAAAQFSGLNTESSYTLVLPEGNVHVDTIGGFPSSAFSGSPDSGNIGIDALTSSSYGTYQLTDKLWIGMSVTAPFGLGTKPDNPAYLGAPLGLTTKVLTFNAQPTLAYKIAPGVTIGAGIQIEYARGKLQFGDGPSGGISELKGDDVGVGGTAGILIEPARGTAIGLGYRSGINHDLDGRFKDSASGFYAPADAKLRTPDLVTLSLRQSITERFRLLGTVEWTNWSRFSSLPISIGGAPAPPLVTNWNDGWYFSIGGEYDYSPMLTLRGGVGYEITPEDDPTKVLTSDPDGDRVWLAVGASYKWSETTTIDVGYSHLFIDSGTFVRHPITDPTVFTGTYEGHADLISFGMRTRW